MPASILVAAVIILGGSSLAAIVWLIADSGDRGRQRLAELERPAQPMAPAVTSQTPGVRDDPVPSITKLLGGTRAMEALQMELIRAGWMLRPSEFIAMCLGAAAGGALLGWLLGGSTMPGILLGGIAAALPYMRLRSKQQKRLKAISGQLPDALDILAGSLRSGFALLRAMQVVRTQMPPPVSEEFGRVVDEVQYGNTIDVALDNLVARTGSYDLELIVSAVQTQLKVGGNLAEVFDSIAGMIRERVQLLGELQAATAEGRMSATILLGMPFAMAGVIMLISPGYLNPLLTDVRGYILIGIGVVLMAIGALVIQKLVNIDV